MDITIEQLVDAIQSATISIDILKPSADYYARRGDYEESSIEIVCPCKLIEALKELE